MIDAVGNPQTVLLLGGTSDIGLATVERFAADRPMRVILAGRPGPRLDAAKARLEQLRCTVQTLDFDARTPATHADVIAKAFADGDVDVTLLAFGVLGDPEQAWTDSALAIELAEVNYVAPVACGVALAQHLKVQRHGALAVFSSVAGERVRRSNFVYGSTKAGMDGFFTGLTEALRPSGVLVTIVRPGFVKSKMTDGLDPAPLSVTPEQVAEITVDAVRKRKELVWAPAPMRVVMSILRHVPRPIFRRLPV
jgi:decaprenylphospho-beta-D-erythro-pentofuranosid-2-ulose 2-reductase